MKGGVIFVMLLSFIISFLMTSCALITNSNPKIISYSPTSNAENVDIHVKLSWIAQDPDGELLIFDVYFGLTHSRSPEGDRILTGSGPASTG